VGATSWWRCPVWEVETVFGESKVGGGDRSRPEGLALAGSGADEDDAAEEGRDGRDEMATRWMLLGSGSSAFILMAASCLGVSASFMTPR
jgi:hypothetical protein